MSVERPGPGEVPAVVADSSATGRGVTEAVGRYPAGYDDRLKNYLDGESAPPFLRYFGLFKKHRALVAGICGAFLFAGFVITFLMPRIYTATTTIQIDREAPKVVRGQDSVLESNLDDPQFYTTQYELLKSRALAERVVSSLSLADKKEFTDAEVPFLGKVLHALFAHKDDDEPDSERRQRQAIGLVMRGLTVQPVRMSRIVKVSFSSRNPLFAQSISTAVAENFVSMTLDRRYSASSYARKFLEEKLQQVRLKLEESEKDVVAYAQKEGIVNVDDKSSVALANLKALNESLAAATAERIKEEQLWAQAQNGNGFGLPQVLDDKSIQKARDRRTELVAEYQEKLGIMKPDFPEMKQLKAQIMEYDRQIKQQVDLVKQAIKARYEAARDQEASFLQKTEKLKAEVLDLRNRSIKYNILQREVDTNRSLYEGLLQQYKEVGVTGAVGINNVSVIDKAEVPKVPSSPSLALNLTLAMFLGALASAATIAVREFLDDTFKVPEEIEENLGLTVLGVVPLVTKDAEVGVIAQEVMRDPRSALAEAYRSLRTSLQFSTTSGAPKTLLITSSQPGEGKSTTAICLATNFAQLGMSVLLINADMRKPSLHQEFGVDNGVGLSNVLTGALDASQVVHENLADGVTFMPSGPIPPNPAELLAGPRFASLLAVASEKFDMVVIDGPPVMGLADAPLLGSLVEGALLVVDSTRTRRRVVRAAVKRLYFARTRVLGALLSKFNWKKVGHTYGYGYGYGGAEYYPYGSREAQKEAAPFLMRH